MRLHVLAVAAALSFVLAGTAAAVCEGQEGSVIFEDNFADDSGGWELNPNGVTVVPPELIFTLKEGANSWAAQNLTFNATDGDFCADFVLPKSIAEDNTVGAAVQFWATDYNNIYMAMTFSNGAIGLFKRVNGGWTTIFMIRDSTAVKPGEANSLRVLAKAGKITVIVNGATVKAVRAQVPTGNLRFGLYAQTDKAPPAPIDVKFTGFKVTTGP